jgi:hypothetical protein
MVILMKFLHAIYVWNGTVTGLVNKVIVGWRYDAGLE